MENEDRGNLVLRYSECVSPMITPHALIRLKENTALDKETLLRMLEWGAYGIVCQIEPDKERHIKRQLLLVVYDKKKGQPCLLVLENDIFGWELLTIYSTYEFHRRRDFVVIKPETIQYALGAQKSFERGAKKSKTYYDVAIVIIEKDKTGRRRSFSKVFGTILKDEYEVYPSVEIFLNFYLTKKTLKFSIPVYSCVDILIKDRTRVVSSCNLQNSLW
jgi:hypothetical protein